MISNRRSVLKMGLAGLLIPQAPVALAKNEQGRTFEAWRRAFEDSVPARLKAANVSGAAVAIISKDTGTRYAAAFGFADIKQQRKLTADTPIHLASVSKLFTASALVQLFERRGYSLDRDVNAFVDFPVRNLHYPTLPITPRQLLTHTSSISDEGYGDYSVEGDPKETLSHFLEDYLVKGGKAHALDKSFLKAKPGRKWDYSNVAIALAGYVVERAGKQDFAAYTQANLLQPLGIHNAHWYLREFAPDVPAKPYRFENGALVELPQEGYPDVPAGMLRCSVNDLAKMLHAMLGGKTGPHSILSRRAIAAMLRRQVDRKIISYQGLGWVSEDIGGHAFVGHSGSDNGATNMVILTKDERHAVAVLMNIDKTDENDRFRSSVTQDLLAGAKLAG